MKKESINAPANDVGNPLVDELIPCIAIDFTVHGFTPEGEIIGFNYYPHEPHPALGMFLLEMCGLDKPFIESPGKIVGIYKNCENPAVVLAPIPRNAESGNVHGEDNKYVSNT